MSFSLCTSFPTVFIPPARRSLFYDLLRFCYTHKALEKCFHRKTHRELLLQRGLWLGLGVLSFLCAKCTVFTPRSVVEMYSRRMLWTVHEYFNLNLLMTSIDVRYATASHWEHFPKFSFWFHNSSFHQFVVLIKFSTSFLRRWHRRRLSPSYEVINLKLFNQHVWCCHVTPRKAKEWFFNGRRILEQFLRWRNLSRKVVPLLLNCGDDDCRLICLLHLPLIIGEKPAFWRWSKHLPITRNIFFAVSWAELSWSFNRAIKRFFCPFWDELTNSHNICLSF